MSIKPNKYFSLLLFISLLVLFLLACGDESLDKVLTCEGPTPQGACLFGEICEQGRCVYINPNPDGDSACQYDLDCNSGYICKNEVCMKIVIPADVDDISDGDMDGDLDGESDEQELEDETEQADYEKEIEEVEPYAQIGTMSEVIFPPLLLGETNNKSVTISSIGTLIVVIDDISFTESSSSDFSITNMPEMPLYISPGEPFVLEITYAQSNAMGYDEAQIFILSNDKNNAATGIVLKSKSVGKPNIICEPQTIVFPIADVLGNELVQNLLCTNIKTDETDTNLLKISVLEIYPSSSVFKTIDASSDPVYIHSGEQKAIPITYNPGTIGEHLALIKIYHDSENNDNPLLLNIAGVAGSKRIDFSPDSLGFGQVRLGTSASKWLNIKASGEFPLTINSILAGLNLSEDFQIDLHGIFDDGDLIIGEGQSVDIEVVFTPTSGIMHNGNLTVDSNAYNSPTSQIIITGVGTTYDVNLSLSQIDFGFVPLGETGNINLLVSNDGEENAQIISALIEDTENVYTIIESSFPVNLLPDQSYLLHLTFTPDMETGYNDASLIITLDDNENPQRVIQITGDGVRPHFATSPSNTTYDFGEVNIGESKEFSFALLNDGEMPVQIINAEWVDQTGDPSALIDIELVGEPVIAVGEQRTLKITISPGLNLQSQLPVAVNASYRILTNDQDNAEVLFNISGTAVDPAIELDPPELSYSFGSKIPGHEADPVYVKLTNTGYGKLIVNEIKLGFGTHISFWLSDLPESFPVIIDDSQKADSVSEINFVVHYKPTIYGTHTGTLQILNDGYIDKDISITLSGAGENCSTGTHNCGGDCVDSSDINHCGEGEESCHPCLEPDNSTAYCVAWGASYMCDFDCIEPYVKEGDSCVPSNLDDCCGGSCEDCTLLTSDNGQYVCSSQTNTCKLDCDPHYHLSAEICAPNDTPDCCQIDCTVCNYLANSNPVCEGSVGATYCDFECWTDFDNCNGWEFDGCETDLKIAVSHCGDCETICSVNHGVAGCEDKNCTISSCSYGYMDCINGYSDGCETYILLDPLHCGDCNQECTIANGTGACRDGSCKVDNCNIDYLDCNSNAGDGCETKLDVTVNTCIDAELIERIDEEQYIRGDIGTDVSAVYSGYGEKWFKFRTRESDTSSCIALGAEISLLVPDSLNYTLEVWSDCSTYLGRATGGTGDDENYSVCVDDNNASDDTFWTFVHIVYDGGYSYSCDPWSLQVERDPAAISCGCNP